MIKRGVNSESAQRIPDSAFLILEFFNFKPKRNVIALSDENKFDQCILPRLGMNLGRLFSIFYRNFALDWRDANFSTNDNNGNATS